MVSMRPLAAGLLLLLGALDGSVGTGRTSAGSGRFDALPASRIPQASASPQIRFTQDSATALVSRKTDLQLTIDPPLSSKSSLTVQSSDPQRVYAPTASIDVLPNQPVVIVPVWAVRTSYSPATVTATLLLDSMGGGPSATVIVNTSNPTPIIRGIDPLSTPAGSPEMTLLVIGNLSPSFTFVSDSVAYWNGSPRPTRPVPIGICPDVCLELLDVFLSEADLASPGTATLVVVNQPPGGGVSNEVTFQIGPASNSRKRPKRPIRTVTFRDLLARRPIGPRP
jgi:hypothetical protein